MRFMVSFLSPQPEDPPFLTVGTEVSAKYKGAFCEAKVHKVVKVVKVKVRMEYVLPLYLFYTHSFVIQTLSLCSLLSSFKSHNYTVNI